MPNRSHSVKTYLSNPSISDTDVGVRFKVHAIPNSRETRITLESDDSIIMRVRAPPVRGKANREIVKWFSKKLDIPSSQIRVVAGLRSRLKSLEISGMNKGRFLQAAALLTGDVGKV